MTYPRLGGKSWPTPYSLRLSGQCIFCHVLVTLEMGRVVSCPRQISSTLFSDTWNYFKRQPSYSTNERSKVSIANDRGKNSDGDASVLRDK